MQTRCRHMNVGRHKEDTKQTHWCMKTWCRHIVYMLEPCLQIEIREGKEIFYHFDHEYHAPFSKSKVLEDTYFKQLFYR